MSEKRKSYVAESVEAHRSSLERRSACRYPALSDSAAFGWWEGTEFRAVAAQVKDISLDGAMVLVEGHPPDDLPVWVRLQGGSMCDWVEASIISITKGKNGPYRVRIKFEGGCPYAFFDSATRGFTQNDRPPRRK